MSSEMDRLIEQRKKATEDALTRRRRRQEAAAKAEETKLARQREHRAAAQQLADRVLEAVKDHLGTKREKRLTAEGLLDPFGFEVDYNFGDFYHKPPRLGNVTIEFYGPTLEDVEARVGRIKTVLEANGIPYWPSIGSTRTYQSRRDGAYGIIGSVTVSLDRYLDALTKEKEK